ncbi:hypothetical protein [Mesorhizobium sp. M0013]|uniref:hypothetical protein n=1 Tax=Mesorhizobium sp. M0013 TaxID=2956841 RepID=UPI00333D175C
MGFEADRMFNLILNDDDIETERNVILEERRWRREADPQVWWTRRSTRRCGQSALPHSGQRLEAGDGEAERHRRIHDLQRIPNNAVLVVAGDAEAETVNAGSEDLWKGCARAGPATAQPTAEPD